MKVLFLGRLADIAGASEIEVPQDAMPEDLASLRRWLGDGRPELLQALENPINRAVIDHEIASGNPSLGGCREIAFMAPVSGG